MIGDLVKKIATNSVKLTKLIALNHWHLKAILLILTK